MSDKMKGPGESDERMPDIEESQFSVCFVKRI